MRKKPVFYILLFLGGVLLYFGVTTLVAVYSNSQSCAALSISDSSILSSNTYYIKYMSKSVLADDKPLVIEEAISGNFSAERYQLDGKTLLSVEDGKHAQIYYDNELIDETDITPAAPSVVARYDGLAYNRSGSVTIEGTVLNYEEYDFISGTGAAATIRFLYYQGGLWGLQFSADTSVQVLELSQNIPEDLNAYFTS